MKLASLLFAASLASALASKPPNIVFILADDLGWNDVGFHGSDQIPTPNIDALAYNGIILNQHYSPALCTPSRSALLTGKFPIHTGMQHSVIREHEPYGLELNETLLPEYLNRVGYKSHAVGKWHLGFFRKEYTPTYRGFLSHYGYWQGYQDYYTHRVHSTVGLDMDGYDMKRGLVHDWSVQGEYSTDIFTREAVKVIEDHDTSSPLFLYVSHLAPHTGGWFDLLQAPDSHIARFPHIEDPERRVYAAMVSKLDESIGEIFAALSAKAMLDNTIVVFVSDNGAPTIGFFSNKGSNFPLRGIKNSAWEGGNRVAAAIWSPLLKKKQRVSNEMMYTTDWLPTLCSAAGIDMSELGNIDGVDMWNVLSEGGRSPRKEFVYNIDDVENPYAAVRLGDWKYLTGSATGNQANDWYGESGRSTLLSYDATSVLTSKTGSAIATHTVRKLLKMDIMKGNNALKENGTTYWSLLSRSTISRIRKEAQVDCKTRKEPDALECNPMKSPCLINLREDPCERVNLATKQPGKLRELEALLSRYRASTRAPRNQPGEYSANPAYWNDTWTCWHDELDKLFPF